MYTYQTRVLEEGLIMFPAYMSEIQDLSSLMALNNYSQVSDGVENLFQTFRIYTNGIPDDPRDWSSEHVCQWLGWAHSTFNLTDLQLDSFLDPFGNIIDGKALCKITKKHLCAKTSLVSGEILWESLQRICAEYNNLQKLHLNQLAMQIGFMEKPSVHESESDVELPESPEQYLSNTLSSMTPVQSPTSSESSGYESNLGSPLREMSPVGSPQQGSMIEPPATAKVGRKKRGPKPVVVYTGNGPIQLYQFLLELLLSDAHKCDVEWTHEEKYEFKLKEPEKVAKMWGKRKNKPKMNYEKLSRGLRYYYGKDIITKVHGKRYVYRFLCDIEKILGYNPTVMDNGFPATEKTELETHPASPAASVESENSEKSENNSYLSSSCDSIFGDDFAFDDFFDDLYAVVPDGDLSAFLA